MIPGQPPPPAPCVLLVDDDRRIVELLEIELGCPNQRLERLGVPLRQEPDGPCCVAEIEPRHHIRVEVVVDDGRVLVGAGDPVDVERAAAVLGVEPEVGPQPCGLDEDLGALV